MQHELSNENLDIHSNFESNYITDKIVSAFPEKNEWINRYYFSLNQYLNVIN